jgi:hypothetical protein
MREELIERVAEFAEEPAAFLRRSYPPEPVGLLVYAYGSAVIEGMQVVLFFDVMDSHRKTIALVAIGRLMGEEDPD